MPRIRRLNFAACLFTLAALMVPVLLAGQAPPPAGGPGGGRRMNRDRVEERMQRRPLARIEDRGGQVVTPAVRHGAAIVAA